MSERFPTPEEQEGRIEEREIIAELAQHLAAENRDDPSVKPYLDEFEKEAGAYMRRMHELQHREKMNPQALGPADYEDLKKFEKGVAKIERQMEIRGKKKM